MLSSTFRSKRIIDMRGSLHALANMGNLGGVLPLGTADMDADLNLKVDLPPILNFAIAQDFGRFRAELVYEHTFWENASIFRFGYENPRFSNITGLVGSLESTMPGTVASQMAGANYDAVYYGQGWKDSSAYRLGLSYFGDTYKLMGSFSYDESPAPQGSFGIPDANAYIFGLGGKKSLSENLDLGAALSLAFKDNRKSFIRSHNGWGQFHIFSLALNYRW